MSKNGLIQEGTHEHLVMKLLVDNGGSVERNDFWAALRRVLPGRSDKTLHSILDRVAREGFMERHITLTPAGVEAMAKTIPRGSKLGVRSVSARSRPRRELVLSEPLVKNETYPAEAAKRAATIKNKEVKITEELSEKNRLFR